MRYGYSLLLREFLQAEEVDYGDCEQFQICCPVCREPTFKKTRSRPDGGETHYLSHYRAASEDEKDCELRVASFIPETFAPFNAESRKQALSSFLTVLKEAIFKVEDPLFPSGVYRRTVVSVMQKPVFKDFAVWGRQSVQNILRLPTPGSTDLSKPDPHAAIVQSLGGFPRFTGQSPFWLRRQAAYTVDVLEHLLTPQARSNLDFLTAAACAHIGLQADGYREKRKHLDIGNIGYSAIPAVNVIEALVKGKSKAALMKLSQMDADGRKVPFNDAERHLRMLHIGIVSELIGPIIGILGAIPFPDIARGRWRTQPEVDRSAKVLIEIMETLFKRMQESRSRAS